MLTASSFEACSSTEIVSFGGADSMYSHEAMNTIIVPGSIRNVRSVLNRIGERQSKIPVDTAVAKHLTTASASVGN